jgi:antitoxin ParD1/3/4
MEVAIMNVSLTPHFEKLVQEMITSGRYGNASEVVREGLRLLEEREAHLAKLRNLIDEGVNSGEPVEWEGAEAIIKKARAAHAAKQKQSE